MNISKIMGHTKGGQNKKTSRNKFLLLDALNGQFKKKCIAKILLLSAHVAITCPLRNSSFSTLYLLWR